MEPYLLLVGVVALDGIAAERAFAGGDLSLRYHFNMPAGYNPNSLLTVTFDAWNLDDTAGATRRFGVEVYINGVLVRGQEFNPRSPPTSTSTTPRHPSAFRRRAWEVWAPTTLWNCVAFPTTARAAGTGWAWTTSASMSLRCRNPAASRRRWAADCSATGGLLRRRRG